MLVQPTPGCVSWEAITRPLQACLFPPVQWENETNNLHSPPVVMFCSWKWWVSLKALPASCQSAVFKEDWPWCWTQMIGYFCPTKAGTHCFPPLGQHLTAEESCTAGVPCTHLCYFNHSFAFWRFGSCLLLLVYFFEGWQCLTDLLALGA